MKCYMIRNKKSGMWLPNAKQGKKVDVPLCNNKAPRYFTTLAHAKNALRYWLTGKLFDGRYSESDEQIKRKEEMEIVVVDVVLSTNASWG